MELVGKEIGSLGLEGAIVLHPLHVHVFRRDFSPVLAKATFAWHFLTCDSHLDGKHIEILALQLLKHGIKIQLAVRVLHQ